MKTMTCRDLGGPCDYKMSAETPEEMMQKGEEHLLMSKDEAHKRAADQMKAMAKKDSQENKDWNEMFMKKWEMA